MLEIYVKSDDPNKPDSWFTAYVDAANAFKTVKGVVKNKNVQVFLEPDGSRGYGMPLKRFSQKVQLEEIVFEGDLGVLSLDESLQMFEEAGIPIEALGYSRNEAGKIVSASVTIPTGQGEQPPAGNEAPADDAAANQPAA